jgi:hypothetical protein
MEVYELWDLTQFSNDEISRVITALNELQAVLNHNSSQPQKQPVLEKLDKAVGLLLSMPLERLNHNQLNWLENLEIKDRLGASGSRVVNSIVRVSDFDPATARDKLKLFVSKLNQAQSKLEALRGPLAQLDWVTEHRLLWREQVEIRIIFQKEAAIENSADLKKCTADWYEIIRGVTTALDQTPEDVQVRGVGNGSVFVCLAGTAAVTLVLAKITKNVSSMALDGIKVLSTIEELKQKRMHTAEIERMLKENHQKDVVERKEALVDEIAQEGCLVLEHEQKRLMEQSIKKMLTFFEKGGELEFIEPHSGNEDDDADEADNDDALSATLAEIRQHKKEVLLLASDKREIEP